MSAFDNTFRAAIPGSSLTHKLGDLPHERPPKFTDPNEALEYFWKQFHRKEILKQIWSILENGGTVFAITRAILYKAALEGVIQMNLGIAIYQTVGKMIETLGKSKGIDVKTNPKFKDKTKDSITNRNIAEKLGDKSGKTIPHSALRRMQLPHAEDISKDADMFKSSTPPLMGAQDKMQEAAPKKGLLNMGA